MILKTHVMDPGQKLEPSLVCDACGDGPFINRFKVVQHKIEECPCKHKQDNWEALQQGVNDMMFEVALVEKTYRKLGATYLLKTENLKRIYKNQIIVTYRRQIPNKDKR